MMNKLIIKSFIEEVKEGKTQLAKKFLKDMCDLMDKYVEKREGF